MRILRVHNRYKQRGGEDVSFEAEVSLLADRGHSVDLLEFANSAILERPPLMDAARLSIETVWSRSALERIRGRIQTFRPQIVHFDNTFPLVSPAAFSVCQQSGVPVVQSLRNYRLVCPSATLFRDGHVCEDCLGKTPPYPGVVHGCYRDSRSQSAVVSGMLTFHRLRQTWRRDVDQYIALSEFARDKFVEGGLPCDRMSVKPNFVDLPAPSPNVRSNRLLYVGRLTPEKGVNTLMEAYSTLPNGKLSIVGDGPMSEAVSAGARAHTSIDYLGRKSEAETYRLMGQSQAVIVPSEWYEPFGRVVVEAFANATPVIASRSGGLTELVEDGRTGLLFQAGNAADLAAKARWADEHPDEMWRMGENARREYERKYTPDQNYEMLMDIYGKAIWHARKRLRE